MPSRRPIQSCVIAHITSDKTGPCREIAIGANAETATILLSHLTEITTTCRDRPCTLSKMPSISRCSKASPSRMTRHDTE
jgi:hypothetical protein